MRKALILFLLILSLLLSACAPSTTVTNSDDNDDIEENNNSNDEKEDASDDTAVNESAESSIFVDSVDTSVMNTQTTDESSNETSADITQHFEEEPIADTVTSVNSAEYDIVREDNSYKDQNGQVLIEHYFDRVNVIGDSAAVNLINNGIKGRMSEFLISDSELADYVDPFVTPEYPYFNTCDTDVTHNDNGYLSLKYTTSWMMGGVCNVNEYGCTYDLNTGLPVTLAELTDMDPVLLEQQLKDETWECLIMENGYDDIFNEAYTTLEEYSLDEFNFCIDDGQIVLLFPTYTFGPGAAGSTVCYTNVYISVDR